MNVNVRYASKNKGEFNRLESGLAKLLKNFDITSQQNGKFSIAVEVNSILNVIEVRPDDMYGSNFRIASVVAKDKGEGRILSANPQAIDIEMGPEKYCIHYTAQK